MENNNSVILEQFLEWVGDSKVDISLNRKEIRNVIEVDMHNAEIWHNEGKNELTFFCKDKSYITLKIDNIEEIHISSDTCCSIAMKEYGIHFVVIKR